LVVAYFSTRFIEDPLRFGRALKTKTRAFLFAALGAGVFLALYFFANNHINSVLDFDIIGEPVAAPSVAPGNCSGPNALNPANECTDIMGYDKMLVDPS